MRRFVKNWPNRKKAKSELLMIVDLERNDLNKICEPGSVIVPDLFAVEEYATVFHLIANVIGTLKPNQTAIDALSALFPGGSITGAPKRRAMEIIDELEPADRGIYGGTVGYFDFSGNMDMAIAIRTAFLCDHEASVQAGAGIVLDSVPAPNGRRPATRAEASVESIQIAAQLREL